MSEAEWQPAIIAPFGSHSSKGPRDCWKLFAGRRVRIMKFPVTDEVFKMLREDGCDAERTDEFALLHLEDQNRLLAQIGEPLREVQVILCKHQFLTD